MVERMVSDLTDQSVASPGLTTCTHPSRSPQFLALSPVGVRPFSAPWPRLLPSPPVPSAKAFLPLISSWAAGQAQAPGTGV